MSLSVGTAHMSNPTRDGRSRTACDDTKRVKDTNVPSPNTAAKKWGGVVWYPLRADHMEIVRAVALCPP